jgi:hypothetical protein
LSNTLKLNDQVSIDWKTNLEVLPTQVPAAVQRPPVQDVPTAFFWNVQTPKLQVPFASSHSLADVVQSVVKQGS